MKIGFLITYFYPQTGGAENNCYFLAKELAKRHEVHVFCSGKEDSEEIIDKIHVHRSKQLFRIKYYLGFYPGIVKKLLKYDLDVLHIHGLGFLQHDYAVSKIKKNNSKIKIICTPHGPFMALKKYNFIGKTIKNIITRSIIKSVKKYDKILQVNPYQKVWMKSYYGIPAKKIEFLPNGISESVFEKISKKDKLNLEKKYNLSNKTIISYLGRIQKYKGMDQIIKILPELLKKDKSIVFLLIGKDADDRDRLTNIANELKIKDKVIFTGEVSEKEKYALLSMSSIFAFPSEWEAFGIATLEAMALGNAVISSRTEGGKYLIKEGVNGYLFDYGGKKELLEKMNKLISDKNKIKNIGKNNILLAKKFLWKDIAKDLEKIYERMIKEK